MNLDDLAYFRTIDTQDMLGHIDGLPGQLAEAWALGQRLPLPAGEGIDAVIIAGMGGSAIGADLVTAYLTPICPVPVVVHRDYDLPAWAKGPGTLVIASSHSGNTEETLSSVKAALKAGCRLVTVSTGGELVQEARQAGAPAWVFQHNGMPRAAVGFSFGLLLAMFTRLGLIPDPSGGVEEAVRVMKEQQASMLASVPVVHNPAKRMAGQLVGRWAVIFGSGYLAPVARRWKGQINELAKAWAQFDFLPEGDHNTLAGLVVPKPLLTQIMALFLRAPSEHLRNQKRTDLTRQMLMTSGLNTDTIDSRGKHPISHIWSTLLYGDYAAYYLAMAYGMDPTPIDVLLAFKESMAR